MKTLLLALAGGMFTIELPQQVVLEPVSLEEFASASAVPWDGSPLGPVPLIQRRLRDAFRLTVPRGFVLGFLELTCQFRENGLFRQGKKGPRWPVRCTVLPLRLVEIRAEEEIYAGDLLLYLDVSRVPAGVYSGLLEVSVVGR